MTYFQCDVDADKRRDILNAHDEHNTVFYIDPNQFAGGTDEDDRAAFDDEVDELIASEAEARDIAQRLADFLEYPVLIQSRREEGTRIIFEPAFTVNPSTKEV